MKFFRRGVVAVVVTGMIATALKVQRADGTPPRTGGWRELAGPDLR